MAVVAFVEMVDGTSVAADLVDRTESRAAESAEVVEYKGPGAWMLPVFGGLDKWLVELVGAVGVAEEGIALYCISLRSPCLQHGDICDNIVAKRVSIASRISLFKWRTFSKKETLSEAGV